MLRDALVPLFLSKNGSITQALLVPQQKPAFYRPAAHDLLCHILAEGRSVLKSVPRASSREPDILHLRVPVNQEIAARSIFILAHKRLDQRCFLPSRETLRDVLLCPFDSFRRCYPRLRIRVHHFSVGVSRQFQSSTLHVRQSINFVRLKQKGGQLRRLISIVPRGRPEEKHFLPGRKYFF